MEESTAFIAWLATYGLPTRAVHSLADLSDGAPLLDVLSIIDEKHFKQTTRPAPLSDNWVIRLASLKKLLRLITLYYADVLHQDISSIDVPDLKAIAENQDTKQTLTICRLVLAIGCKSEDAKMDVVSRIQRLDPKYQAALMGPIDQAIKKMAKHYVDPSLQDPMNDDDHFYQLQLDRKRILEEKETLESVYQALIVERNALQGNFDDAVLEKEAAVTRAKDAERQSELRRNDKSDALMRAELDRIRLELQKSEDNLGAAEAELEKQTNRNAELGRKVEELQVQANLAAKLKDQVDEYKHSAEKVQKMENVMEKYKKKLEESAELRRVVKTLEDQNAQLVDTHASLSAEYKKISAFRPLMDSYKSSISELETKASARTKEVETLKFSLEQAQSKLAQSVAERQADAEALELYQERVRELELADPSRGRRRAKSTSNPTASPDPDAEAEAEAEAADASLGGELDDATSGRTMTDMKLEIRALKREISDLRNTSSPNLNGGSGDDVQVLETLLEDAKKSKARYEQDYLLMHREKLVLQSQLDEIRAGRGTADSGEAAIALRQRLNEVVDELDTLRLEHNQLSVDHENQARELTIAKSDLNLVNKDQLEILAALRESVNEDKSGLEGELRKVQAQVAEMKEKHKMQLEQINTLLMEKVNLQSDGIGQRERMLERERNYADFRASTGSRGTPLPEEPGARARALQEENDLLKERNRADKEKYRKAMSLVKEQAKMLNERKTQPSDNSNFAEAEAAFQHKIRDLEARNIRLSQNELEQRKIFSREQRLLLSYIHQKGLEQIRLHQANHRKPNGGLLEASSWLKASRLKTSGSLR